MKYINYIFRDEKAKSYKENSLAVRTKFQEIASIISTLEEKNAIDSLEFEKLYTHATILASLAYYGKGGKG